MSSSEQNKGIFGALWQGFTSLLSSPSSSSSTTGKAFTVLGTVAVIGGSVYVVRRLFSRGRAESAPSLEEEKKSVEASVEKVEVVEQVERRRVWRRTIIDLLLMVVVLVFALVVLLQEKLVLIAAPGMFMFLRYLLYVSPFETAEEESGIPVGGRRKEKEDAAPIGIKDEEEKKEAIQEKLQLPVEVKNQWEFPEEMKSNPQFFLIPAKSEYLYKHPWKVVAEKLKTRFPDPLKPKISVELLKSDEMEVVLQDGEKVRCRFTHREIRSPAKIPYMLKSLVGAGSGDYFRLDEKTVELSECKFLKKQTTNRDFRNVCVVMIVSELRVHSEQHPDWTILEEYGAVQFMASVGFFKAQLQGVAEKTFKEETLENAKRIEILIQEDIMKT